MLSCAHSALKQGAIFGAKDLATTANASSDDETSLENNRETAEGLGLRIRYRRKKRVWTLDQLADASGVSRAGISRIERGETVPSTTTLSRIAEALGITFAELMPVHSNEELVLLKACEQPVFTDDNGFERRCIAPILPSRGLDWVHNTLPAGETTGIFYPHISGVEEYIYVLEGALEACLGEARHKLQAGDSLYYRAQVPRQFTTVGNAPCQYFIIINAQR